MTAGADEKVESAPDRDSPKPSSTARISVCIVCRNEADRLRPCLVSVAEWADEIVVLDLSSSDGSADLAREYGAVVVPHAPVPVVEQVRNEVAQHATGDWILALDPDERVTPGLAAELLRLRLSSDIDLVVIPFMHFDFGHPSSSPHLRYDPKPRMYRRDRVVWPSFPNALPHAAPERTYRLPNRDDLVMIHDRNRTIEEALDRVIRYAPAQAQAMVEAGRVFAASEMFTTLFKKALRQFYLAKASEDGMPGIIRASVLVIFHFYVWAEFWRLSGATRAAHDDKFVRRVGIAVNVVGRGAFLAAAATERLRPLARGISAAATRCQLHGP